MSRFIALIVASLISLPIIAAAGEKGHEPSVGAKGMAGTKGTIEYKPEDWIKGQTTWWKDTDGIDPGKAGCHIGTDSKGKPNGRLFGEACLDDGRLVESNPGANELHSHKDDIGHPDTFNCSEWCVSKGKSGGSCIAAAAPPCKQSAMCACK